VNSSTQVASQFPSQAYLFVYIISKSWGRSASLRRPSIQVVGHQDMKQGVHWPADFISHAYISVLQENIWRPSSALKRSKWINLCYRRMRMCFSDSAFSAAGPRCSNSLPPTIRLMNSVKSKLKIHLFVRIIIIGGKHEKHSIVVTPTYNCFKTLCQW